MTVARPRPIVTIDGPAGAGKSTVARAVARRLGFRYVNTGAMYRAVALIALRSGVAPSDAEEVAAIARRLEIAFAEMGGEQRVVVAGRDVTDALLLPEVGEAASVVSTHPAVREALVRLQRRLGADGGVVMEGRDIGTVVFPDAEVKIYLTASPEERAQRRHRELTERGIAVDLDDLREASLARDQRDADRAHSPLRVAEDALLIDTSGRTVDDVADQVVALIQQRSGAGKARGGAEGPRMKRTDVV